MQHVGVTSASEVHKYPADIGKYLVSFIIDAWMLAIVFLCHTLKCIFPGKRFFFKKKKLLKQTSPSYAKHDCYYNCK